MKKDKVFLSIVHAFREEGELTLGETIIVEARPRLISHVRSIPNELKGQSFGAFTVPTNAQCLITTRTEFGFSSEDPTQVLAKVKDSITKRDPGELPDEVNTTAKVNISPIKRKELERVFKTKTPFKHMFDKPSWSG